MHTCRTSCACLTLRVRTACTYPAVVIRAHHTVQPPVSLSRALTLQYWSLVKGRPAPGAKPCSTSRKHGRHATLLWHSSGAQTIGRAGKRLAAVETAALKVLLAKLEVAHALVQTCSEPGELCLLHQPERLPTV